MPGVPVLSLSPRVGSNSCPLSQWCSLIISFSAALFFFCLPSYPASVFSNESALYFRWPKNWSLSSSISPSNEYSVLFSFRMDWFDFLAIQGTLKSLLQHNLKETVLWHSALSMAELSHPCIATEKAITLTIWTLWAKWCLCFLIHYVFHSFLYKEQVSFNFVASVTICSDCGAKENKMKSVTASTFSHSICHEVMGPGTMIIVVLNFEF